MACDPTPLSIVTDVAFAGSDLARVPPHRRGFGFMFQDGALFPHRDVAGNVAFGLRVRPKATRPTDSEIRDRVPVAYPDRTAIRYRVEQLSAVEHATVLGVPVTGAGGAATMTRGLGRPLVITTLEIPEAMRVLAGGRRGRPILAVSLLAGGAGLLGIGVLWAIAQTVLAGGH